MVPDLQRSREHALEEGCDYGVHDHHDRQVPLALGSDLLEGALAALLVEALSAKGALAHLVSYAKEGATTDFMVNTSVIHHNLSGTLTHLHRHLADFLHVSCENELLLCIGVGRT